MAGTQLPTPVIGNKAHQPCMYVATLQFLQCEFSKTSLVKHSFYVAAIVSVIAGRGCTVMKTKILPSVFMCHCSLEQPASVSSYVAWRKLWDSGMILTIYNLIIMLP